ncbi:MAG: hypothetical protein IJK15_04485 [Bacteroidaceae bacterium]|nr:hypothetical protein [Bacteroidaceae bacterium]
MVRKELQIPFFVLLLVIACSWLAAACGTRSGRLIAEAEALAYVNPDSDARVLAMADTSALSEEERAHLALAQALVHEEEWQRRFGDTVVCLTVTDTAWEFHRVVYNQSSIGHRTEDDTLFADSSLLRAYHYYYRKSFCGTSDDKEVVRRFGRTCYALSRRYDDTDSLLQFDMLIHQAIHAAEAAEDWATAYRAYHRWSEHSYFAHGASKLREAYWSLCQALKCYDLSRDCSQNFLWLINDYGRFFLHLNEIDPNNFPLLLRAAELTYDQLSDPPYATVYQLIDSVQHAHALLFQCSPWYSYSVTVDKKGSSISNQEVFLSFDRYRQKREAYEALIVSKEYFSFPQSARDKWFWDDQQKCARLFGIECRNYTAAGLALKASALQSRLMAAVIAALGLSLLVLLLLLWNWRNRLRRKHEAERAERAFESARAVEQAERLAEQLRQKDTMIAMLRGHIMDKSEILERLEQGAGGTRRTVIDARNWREIEATLDTMDNGFVQRLRNDHPQFSEDDIRLCMLTRLKLSNNALASIYSITISAVQHRKQKLKKDGFGVTDPAVSLEQVIATY